MIQKLKIKKGDQVVIRTGRDKGKKGAVLKVFPKEQRIVVQGVNLVKRHTTPTQANSGGIVQKEAPIHISNVGVSDPKSGEATRVGSKVLEDGKKVRVSKRSGEVISN